MPTTNELILQGNLRHMVGVRRLGSSLAAKATHLLKQTEKELSQEIERRTLKIMQAVQAGKDPLGTWTLDRLKALRQDMTALRRESFGAVGAKLPEELYDLAGYELGFQEKLLSNAMPINVSWTRPSHHQLKAILTRQPFGGQGEQPARLLSKWVHSIESLERTKIDATLRQGLIQGQTIRQMVGRVQAITGQSRTHAEAVTRTAVTHVSNAARGLLYKANTDVIKGELFVATLDERTTLTCAGLDGTEWEVGEGPVPPLHVNCRSTRTPVTKSWKELGIKLDELPPGQRPFVVQKMTGQVPSTQTFTNWLRGQPDVVQDDWMGPVRAKIFRANPEMPLREFLSTVDHRPLTLAQLAEKEGLVILDVLSQIPQLKSLVATTQAAIAESNIIKAAAEQALKSSMDAAKQQAADAAAAALELAKKQKLSDAAKKAAVTKAAKKAAAVELEKASAAAESAAKAAADKIAKEAAHLAMQEPVVLFKHGADATVDSLNGVPFHDLKPGWWSSVDDVKVLHPSKLDVPLGPDIKRRVGVVVLEDDGRIWMRTMDGKSRLVAGDAAELSQQHALRLAWEQTGLETRIVDELGDTFDNGTSTRWFVARRVGGNPWNAPAGNAVALQGGAEAAGDLVLGTHRYMAMQARLRAGQRLTQTELALYDDLENLYGLSAQLEKVHAVNAAAKEAAEQLQAAEAQAAKKAKASNAAVKAAATKKAKKLAEQGAAKQAAVKELDGTAWKQVGPQAGTNPGARFVAGDGTEWYVKWPKEGQGLERLQEELAANRLYRRAGIKVPELELVKTADGRLGVASKIQPGKVATANDSLKLAKAGDVKEGFVFDAWLGNWDVAGASFDNLLVDELGKVYRIDVGGSLRYRAQGKLKSGWGEAVTELDTLRDSSVNPNTAKLFSQLSEAEIVEQVKYLQSVMSDDVLMSVLDSVPNLPDKTALFNTLRDRREWLLKWAKKAQENAAKQALKASAPIPGDLIDANGVRSFAHDSQAIHWADSNFAKWEKGLTSSQRAGIKSYTDSGFSGINRTLRSERSLKSLSYGEQRHIFEALEKGEVPEDIWTWRGIRDAPKELLKELEEAVPGTVSRDWGFASTAIGPGGAFGGPVKFKILVRRGTKAGWVYNISRHKTELELLLQAGTKYRYRTLPKKIGGTWYADLEIILP